jgi:hypothetical protein
MFLDREHFMLGNRKRKVVNNAASLNIAYDDFAFCINNFMYDQRQPFNGASISKVLRLGPWQAYGLSTASISSD